MSMDRSPSYRWSSQVRASMAGLSTDAKREYMDAKIRRTEEDLLDMKSFRNTLSPFTSLPNELIVEIIVCTQVADPKRDLEWLKLTHVCCHWRAVALSTPWLWMELRIHNNVPLMDAILQRSKGAKLWVTARLSTSVVSEKTETILHAHADRVHHLCICHSSHKCDLKDICFSTLESLQVERAAPDYESDVDDQADVNFDFVRDSARFPRLRILSLKNVAFPRPSQVLTSLVHLELSNLHDPPRLIDALLDTLESMKHLEVLEIEGCQLSFATTHGKPPRTVSLERLRRLCLGDESPNLAFLLPRLDIPTCASLQLNIVIPDADSDEEDLIISVLPRDKSCIPNFSAFRNVRIILSESGFQCSADVQDVFTNPPPFRLSACWEDGSGNWYSDDLGRLHELGSLFSALSVTILDLDSSSCILLDDDEYRSLLRGFPHVDHLKISTEDIVPFLVALDTYTADSHGEPLCPKLRTLVARVEEPLRVYGGNDSKEVIPALLNALRSRASCGMVLEQLILRDSVDDIRNGVKVVAELESLVGVLKFEGVLVDDSDSVW
ncbi:hypothetical protein B0H21DRAFT_208851 [Amylocystis lapponica]|nr:hypothetical protein B0H21DRAFT_208851 [Amylocystis lapponica]